MPTALQIFTSASQGFQQLIHERNEHGELVYTQRAQRVGCSTCGDNAESKAASLVKILTGDCQRGCVDKTTPQAYSSRETKKKVQVKNAERLVSKNTQARAVILTNHRNVLQACHSYEFIRQVLTRKISVSFILIDTT